MVKHQLVLLFCAVGTSTGTWINGQDAVTGDDDNFGFDFFDEEPSKLNERKPVGNWLSGHDAVTEDDDFGFFDEEPPKVMTKLSEIKPAHLEQPKRYDNLDYSKMATDFKRADTIQRVDSYVYRGSTKSIAIPARNKDRLFGRYYGHGHVHCNPCTQQGSIIRTILWTWTRLC